MSINMTNNYYKMHTEVLSICAAQGIRILPGKRAAYEIITGEFFPGIKEFLLFPDDFDKFMELCVPELKDSGYSIEHEQIRNNSLCRVLREDMLATSVPALMNNPDGRHSPQFIIRKLVKTDSNYSFTSFGVTNSFDLETINKLMKVDYMESEVYVAAGPEEHMKNVCGIAEYEGTVSLGYFLMSTECPQSEFIEEAKKRGYLSDERIARYKEHREWKKKHLNLNNKENKEYRDKFLSLAKNR